MAIDHKQLAAIHAKLSYVPCIGSRPLGIDWQNVDLKQARKGNILFVVHGGDVLIIDGRNRTSLDLVGSWGGANDNDRKLYCELVGFDFSVFQQARRFDREKEKKDERERDVGRMRHLAKKLGYRISKGINE